MPYKDPVKRREAAREAQRRWHARHPERAKEVCRRSKAKNREKIAAVARVWRANNVEKLNQKRLAWDLANPDRANEIRRAARKKWEENNPGKTKAAILAWNERNPDRRFEYTLQSKYGISLSDWHAMLVAQAGRCATCSLPLMDAKGPQVDHCHTTGRVRGLLCVTCNCLLGAVEKLRRLPELLASLNAYLGEP